MANKETVTSVPTEIVPLSPEAKLKAAQALAKKANSGQGGYGPGTLMRMGERPAVIVPSISTGMTHFDHEALGVGGVPRGRIIEIFGPESSGKSSITDLIIAACQQAGGQAAKIDAEHAIDPSYSSYLGVDLKSLWLNQPSNAEEGLNLLVDMVESNAFDLAVLDSVAALVAQAELDGEVGDAHVGVLARLMAQTLRKITGMMNKGQTKTTVIFVNQIREKIGVMYGNPETQPGGRALKFYASVRIDVRRKGWINAKGGTALADGESPVGQRIKAKIIKNKVASPFRTSELDLYFPDKLDRFPRGFDKRVQTIDLAFERGVLYKEGNGTKYFFKGEEVAIGQDKAKLALLEDVDLFARVQAAVIDSIKNPKPTITV